MSYTNLTNCRICGSENLKKYLDLGSVPLANRFLPSKDHGFERYPLEVLFCEDCYLSQLSIVVDPKVLYENYPYHSSVSSTFKAHCHSMALSIKSLFESWVDPLVLDIASNDGCLLEQFKACGYYVMGVEPSKNLADEANAKGLSTIHGFFDDDVATRIPALDVVTATNVLAHVDDVKAFILRAKSKLRRLTKGIMVIEVPYLVNLIRYKQFDTIYHEHLSYFLLGPLIKLFNLCGMSIFKVDEHPIHGGSLRIYASNTGDYEEHESVAELEQYESVNGYYDFSKYDRFSNDVKALKDSFVSVVKSIKNDGKSIAGYGASAKGVMFMNYCNIDSSVMDYVVDDTLDKQGKFVPGCGIPIVDRSNFTTNHPDYITLFAWNFSDELMDKTRDIGAKYIVPIPDVKIL